ncbi:zinc finger protein 850-like isoform X2 [Liolophura sinensis]|uniref:zinc finger protein 850-like isoform X2 n=1 Tax=Liolophura sinensis TaxID=3198878 RepID=UPI00315884E5
MRKHYVAVHQSKVKLLSKIRNARRRPNLYTCPRCGEWFPDFVNLRRHATVAHKIDDHHVKNTASEKFKCRICDRAYSSLGNVTRHMKDIHKVSNVKGLPKPGAMGTPGSKAQTPMTSPKGSTPANECPLCVKFIVRTRELRRHLHVSHGLRLGAWDSQNLKAQILLLRTYIWKQLQTTFGPKPCLTCIRSRLLLRAINRHCGRPHSAKTLIPKTCHVKNSGMSPKITKLPSLARLPHSVKSPISMKSPNSSEARGSSKSVGSFSIVKGSKLLVKIKPIDSDLTTDKVPTTPVTSRTATTSLPGIGLLDSSADEKFDYVCPICNCGFWLANSLLRHQNTLLQEKRRICKKCGAGFRSCQALSVHYAEGCESAPQKQEEGECERYKCEVCKESFSQLDTLVRHHRQQHRNAVHTCKFCRATFRTLNYLRYHIKRKHANKGSDEDQHGASEPLVRPIGQAVANQAVRIKTERLDEPCTSGNELAVVMREGESDPVAVVKTEPKDFSPGAAVPSSVGEADRRSGSGDSEASSEGQRPKSFIQIEDGRYQCKNCGALFQTLRSLVQHQKVQHSMIRHRCPKCPAGFRTRVYLNYHCKRQHGITDPETERPVATAGRTQSPISDKFMNKSKKGRGSYRCQVCGSLFKLHKSLREHHNKQHRETTCGCHVCGARFKTHSYLLYHLNRQHGMEEGEVIVKKTPTSKPDEKSPTECDICGAKFFCKKSLRPHKLSQHEVINHHCSECPAGFTTVLYLCQHLKNQHGVVRKIPTQPKPELPKPGPDGRYECPICSASFAHHKNMVQHRNVQHRSIRYRCTVCKAGFSKRSYLDFHLKKCHSGEKGADKDYSITLASAKKSVTYDVSNLDKTSKQEQDSRENSDKATGDVSSEAEESDVDVDDKEEEPKPGTKNQMDPEKEPSGSVSSDQQEESKVNAEGQTDSGIAHGQKEKVSDVEEVTENVSNAEKCEANDERTESCSDNGGISVDEQANEACQENVELCKSEIPKEQPSMETPEGQGSNADVFVIRANEECVVEQTANVECVVEQTANVEWDVEQTANVECDVEQIANVECDVEQIANVDSSVDVPGGENEMSRENEERKENLSVDHTLATEKSMEQPCVKDQDRLNSSAHVDVQRSAESQTEGEELYEPVCSAYHDGLDSSPDLLRETKLLTDGEKVEKRFEELDGKCGAALDQGIGSAMEDGDAELPMEQDIPYHVKERDTLPSVSSEPMETVQFVGSLL